MVISRAVRRGGLLSPQSGSHGDGEPSRACVFLTFCSKSELTPCVFEVFWISGFPVPVRERLPKGNLPLSEVPPSEHLTECRRIPEEFQRKSGGIKRPVGGTPHASRAGRHGGGYIIYIYVCMCLYPSYPFVCFS